MVIHLPWQGICNPLCIPGHLTWLVISSKHLIPAHGEEGGWPLLQNNWLYIILVDNLFKLNKLFIMSFSGHCHNGDHLPQIKNNRIFFMQKLLQNTIDLSFANFAFSRNRNLGKGGLHSICYHRETITEIFGETKLQLSCTTGNRTDYSSI